MKIVIVFCIAAITANIVYAAVPYEIVWQWHRFQCKYNKTYATEEEYILREMVFSENVKLILKHNQLYATGNKTYELEFNSNSDLTSEEFHRGMNDFITIDPNVNKDLFPKYSPFSKIKVPSNIDYRAEGYVTSVKNQRSCDASWAFSAAGAIEGQRYRSIKVLEDLSAQNLIDCTTIYGNNGCESGEIVNAFRYFKDVGINREADYPYEALNRSCRFNPAKSIGRGQGFKYIFPSESYLMRAVAYYGPISTYIHAAPDFRWYKSGIYYNADCSDTNLNHSVLIVGYGTNEQGHAYWIVKNSWGVDWGDQGYAMMARNRDNNCGIATIACVPMVGFYES